jgi:hypothetical protein
MVRRAPDPALITNIEDLYGRGITARCSASPLLYCPTSLTTRSQMAAFLAETFNLP